MRGRIAVLTALILTLLTAAGCAGDDPGDAPAAERSAKAELTTAKSLSIRTTYGKADRYVSEVLAAAFEKAGYVPAAVGRLDDVGQVDPASSTVYLFDDLDVLERQPKTQPQVALAELYPGTALMETKARSRDVVVIREDRAKDLGDPGTFRELVEHRKPLILGVRQAILTDVQGALARDGAYAGVQVSGEDVSDPVGFLEKAPDAAVIVPDHDPILIGDDKKSYRVLEDRDGVLPERTLVVLSGAGVDPAARSLVAEVAEKLDRETIDTAATGKVKDFPASAEKWVSGADLSSVGSPSPSSTPDPGPVDEGSLLLLIVLIGLFVLLATAAALRFRAVRRQQERRYRREENRRREEERRLREDEYRRSEAAPQQWADQAVTRPVRDRTERLPLPPSPVASPTPADTAGPLFLGRAPNPRPVHLPYESASEQPGVALDGGMLKGTTIRAASVRGRSHAYRGETRQDAYGVRLAEGEQWVIVAVADGVGSARHADRASTTAVQAVLDRVNDEVGRSPYPREWDWKGVLAHVSRAIEAATAHLGPAVRGTNARGREPVARPATTLTVGVVPAAGEGQGVCVAVGDSPALLLSGGTWYELVGGGVGGAHANLTTALPGDPESVETQVFEWRQGDVLLLSSDGFAVGLERGRGSFAQRLATEWRVPPDLREFYRQVDFRASTHEDDRTAVAIWAGNHDTAVR